MTVGCTKKLTCSKEDQKDYITTKEIVTVTYQENDVNNIQIDLQATIDEKYSDYVDTVKENLEEQFTKYEDVKGISFQSNRKDNAIHINLLVEFSKMKEKDKEKFKFTNLKNDYDELKKSLEEEKYTCN